MRIALFHSTLPSPTRKVGGVEVVVHQLANHLVHAGHAVTVFSLSPRPDDARYDHKQLFARWPRLITSPFLRLFVLPILLNGVSFRDYDVVHFHGDDWFYLRRSVPSVRTLHGSALEEARTARSWKRRLVQRLLYPLEHLAVRLSTTALAIGPKTARLYPRTVLVNNGVDLTRFRPGPKSPQPRILFVGTWGGRKRGEFLFDLFRDQVLPVVPDATLVMVCDHVSDACASHPNVAFHARPSDEQLAQLYREAWVFAFPSTYEGFGLPYVESMASGTAVLTSPNDGGPSRPRRWNVWRHRRGCRLRHRPRRPPPIRPPTQIARREGTRTRAIIFVGDGHGNPRSRVPGRPAQRRISAVPFSLNRRLP